MATSQASTVADRVQGHIEWHIGKALEEARNQRREQYSPVGRVCDHAQRTTARRMEFRDEAVRGIGLFDHPLGVGVEHAAPRR